jgi:hypothetical protein
MTLVELTINAAATAAFIAAGYAVYQAIKGSGTVSTRSDDPPIRVKGGSVTVTADDDWVYDAGASEFKLTKDNTKLRFWSITLRLDGVPDGPVFGRVVEVDVVAPDPTGDVSSTVKLKAYGGVRVSNPESLNANKNTLTFENGQAYMAHVRVRGGPSPKDFGPFSPKESKLLLIELLRCE